MLVYTALDVVASIRGTGDGEKIHTVRDVSP
jgi:hypothetical protein